MKADEACKLVYCKSDVYYDEERMIPPPDYKIRLKKKIVLTNEVREFVFELVEPQAIEFKAGQFVLIKTTDPKSGEFLSRAYSLLNPPQENSEIRLNVKILQDGKLTPLMDAWEEGQEIEMQGPFGHFVVKSDVAQDLFFVGTGVGVAPLRSMIEDLLLQNDARKIHLCFGVRSQEHIFYQDFFEELEKKYENFDFIITLSQPKDGWEGQVGRVTAHLPTANFDPTKTDFYICGGKPMVDDVLNILSEKGVPEEQVFFEQFFV